MADVGDKPKPIELCLERIQSSAADRYVRCTAQVGRELGLALGIDGRILWCEQSGVGCEIWVSADQRLMACCPTEAPKTVLYRVGRTLELPRERPVVLRHRDELELAGTRFRVHVHGVTERAHAPTIVRSLARVAAAATLAVAVGGSAGCHDAIAVGKGPDAAPSVDSSDTATIILLPSDVAPTISTDSEDIDGEEPTDAPIEVLESPPII
jgi:hypothetical protein